MKSGVLQTARNIGLGSEAEKMLGEVEGTFKSLDKMTE